MSKFHLAQLNIAKAKKPLDDPIMSGFVNRLDEINTLGEQSPGFVWRLKDDTSNNSMEFQMYDDPLIIVNLTVWEDLESLKNFTYKTAHAEVMRQRKKWFEHFGKPYMVLWWIPAGHHPTVEEARTKLELLQEKGPTQEAFNFKNNFPPLE